MYVKYVLNCIHNSFRKALKSLKCNLLKPAETLVRVFIVRKLMALTENLRLSKGVFFLKSVIVSGSDTVLSHPGVLRVIMATRWWLVIPVRDATATGTPTLTWSSTSATMWRATASTAGETPPVPTARGVPRGSMATPSLPRTAEVGATSKLQSQPSQEMFDPYLKDSWGWEELPCSKVMLEWRFCCCLMFYEM